MSPWTQAGYGPPLASWAANGMNDRIRELEQFRLEAEACDICRAEGLLFNHPSVRPLLPRRLNCGSGVLVVFEAPNRADTVDKGYLSIGLDTDPTGAFATLLLEEVAGVDVLETVFTNSVLCLPKQVGERFPVGRKQRRRCQPLLASAIHAAEPRVVVSFGVQALAALEQIAPHGLTLARSVGKAHDWLGRKLVPLYHPGNLGRANRKPAAQVLDALVIRKELHGEAALPRGRSPAPGELCGLTKSPGYSSPEPWHSVCRVQRHQVSLNGMVRVEFTDYLYAEGVQNQVVVGLSIPAWGNEYLKVWEEWPPRQNPKSWRRVSLRPLTWEWAVRHVVPSLSSRVERPRNLEQLKALVSPR